MRVVLKRVEKKTGDLGGRAEGGKGCLVEDRSKGLPRWVVEGNISVTL